MEVKSKIYRVGFFVIIALIFLMHNDSVSLWDQDEGAYAGFASEMIETGNLLVPDFLWSDKHRKPPLHFWNIALSYKAFGVNEFSVRFPSALFLFLTLLFIYKGTRSFLDENEGFLSAFVLATTLFVGSLAKISVTDGTLLFFSTVCAVQLINQVHAPSWKNVALFWVSFSLGLLTKGPPIIIFTGFFGFLLLVFHPKRWRLIRFHPWIFLPLAALPLLSWGYLAWQTDDGKFISWMVDWYVLKRIGGSVLGQSAPFGSHFLFILLSFVPYLFAFPVMIKSTISGFKQKNWLWITPVLWFIGGWFLYEFTPSKLPAYTVVSHVPLAIIIAKCLAKSSSIASNKLVLILQVFLATIFILGIPFAGFYLDLGTTFLVTSILVSVALLVLIAVGIRRLSANQNARMMLVYNLVFIALLWSVIYPQIDVLKNSPKQVAEELFNSSDKSLVVVGNSKGHPPSLVFYLTNVFDEVIVEKDAKKLTAYANDGKALVLNEAQFNALAEETDHLQHRTICTHFTDRKGDMCYYLIYQD